MSILGVICTSIVIGTLLYLLIGYCVTIYEYKKYGRREFIDGILEGMLEVMPLEVILENREWGIPVYAFILIVIWPIWITG